MGGSNREGEVMIPPSVAAAVAPVLIDKFVDKVFGGAASPPAVTHPGGKDAPVPTPEASAPNAAPPGVNPGVETALGLAREYFDHEKSKAAVRPAIMKMSGRFTIAASLCYVAAAFGPAFGLMTVEHSTHAMEALLWAMGGGASFYGYKHTVRSVDKWKGTS